MYEQYYFAIILIILIIDLSNIKQFFNIIIIFYQKHQKSAIIISQLISFIYTMSVKKGVDLRRDLLKQNDMKNFSEQKLAENDVNISFSADIKATTFQVDENYSKQIENELDGSKNIFFQLDGNQNFNEQPSSRSFAVKKQIMFKSSSVRIDELGGEKLDSDSIAQNKQNNTIVSLKDGTSTSIKNKNIPSKENIQSQQIRLSNLANTINEFKKKKRMFQSKSFLDKPSEIEQENEKLEQSQNQQEKQRPLNFLFFKQTNIIKRFISNLQSKARSFIFKRLSQHQFNLIGDKSSDYISYQEMNLIIKHVIIESINQHFAKLLLFKLKNANKNILIFDKNRNKSR
ncbi:transmembrane protein, putative (macronuclear) [Tetrahymena thermophila SB210]|uniref:Transmembrane protein, putative n=1 Tax=Tetrahymena thermophila (strain SB210) TaxID=312017 RepID=Q229T0_TETTS|nr:transmembrane protein, putative [Tetrahymena thermophila SB210]EAR82045.2 transmembrane protein, putative [Tetrahymena thermophila SB210]|eukprot:XP_001029708.2 transmembrane protein, putative [Tetrahymena thermophila SB210]